MATQTGMPSTDPAGLPDQAAMAGDGATDIEAMLAEMQEKAQRPNELKWRLTSILYPSILLIFVALYVSGLVSGVEPEMALLSAGGASLVLAVLARVAVGIIADEKRLVLNDSQIVAMARSGAVREYLSNAGLDPQAPASPKPAAEQPSTAAKSAGPGGKE
ncbi:MAG: hypothetical protein IT306_17830 [Chloroflexi bacterium]|nr:hypothetical protein [Chloroflexota bacterium]